MGYFTMCVVLLLVALKSSSLDALSIHRTKTSESKSEIIYLNQKSDETIRLKSVLSFDVVQEANARATPQKQIFWIFKRIHSIPTFSEERLGTVTSSIETSQKEQMISLDMEVESKLKRKYSISGNFEKSSESSLLDYDLVIHNLTYADSGLYVCNQWNQKTIYYQLVVSSPVITPEITLNTTETDLTDEKLISEGSNVTIKCQSSHAYPYPSIKWFKNNQEVPNMSITYSLIDMETNKIESTLHIFNVSNVQHLSNFSCQLSQITAETTNTAVAAQTIHVAFKPVITLSVLKAGRLHAINGHSLTLFNDTDLTFVSKFQANPMKDSVTKWLVDGQEQEVDANGAFRWLDRSNRLDHSAVNMTLTCQVGNRIGVSEYTVDITLAYPPKITAPKASKYDLNESTQFQLNCQVDSFPQANLIRWLHFPTPHSDTYNIASNTSLLHIPSVHYSKTTGHFICAARNLMIDSFNTERIGKVISERIELNVKFMPQLNVEHTKVAANLTMINLGSFKQNITCQAAANPAPQFEWFKDGKKLTQINKKYTVNTFSQSGHTFINTLTINNLSILDLNRNYECVVRNFLGSNRAKIELVPMSKPDHVTEFHSTFVNFMTTTLAWTPGFDGGLSQSFNVRLNNTNYSVDNSSCTAMTRDICIEKLARNRINVHNLQPNGLYDIELSAYNSLGMSTPSRTLQVRLNDLKQTDIEAIPSFENLVLNVPKNRLEFKIKPEKKKQENLFVTTVFCFRIRTDTTEKTESNCLPVSELATRQRWQLPTKFLRNNLKSMTVATCYLAAPHICSRAPSQAIIDTYDLTSQSDQLTNPPIRTPTETSTPIPVALSIGIAICIIALLTVLLLTVCYCIRKRNFKICKSLLTTASLNVTEKHDPSGAKPISFGGVVVTNMEDEKKAAHLNRTFNIDIGSISAPIGPSLTESSASSDLNSAGYGTGGSGLNVINGSMTSSITENNNSRTGYGSKLNEILVVEDSEQQLRKDKSLRQVSLSKSSSSTGVSNCSSLNNNPTQQATNQQYLYTEFMSSYNNNLEMYNNHNNSSSTGSNSDPIAINNSLSSAHSTADNSPTYGYNVANATTSAVQKVEQFEDSDNLLYIKTGIQQKGYKAVQTSSSNSSTSGISSGKPVSNGFNGTQMSDATESGYSTPARLKKVVYEVIV